MKIRNLIAATLVAASVVTAFAMPVMAANNGWTVENGKSVYYENGVKAQNKWVANGDKYYFICADGYTRPEWSMSAYDMSLANGTAVKTTAPAATVVTPAAAPALDMAEISRLEDNYFRRHSYNASYGQYDDNQHKAYCYCGEWSLAPHAWDRVDGKEKCHLCGQKR